MAIVMYRSLLIAFEVDVDAWDGYRANRNRVLDHIQNNKISNTLILSGDSHANWVSDLIRKRFFIRNLIPCTVHSRA